MNIKIYKQNIIQNIIYQCELKDFFLGIVYFLVFKSAFSYYPQAEWYTVV